MILVVIVLNSLIGGLCAYIATKKNRSGGLWFFLGFMCSFFALLAIAVVSDASNNQAGSSASSDDTSETRACPFCAELVKVQAKICKHCKAELPEYKKAELTPEELMAAKKREKQLLESYNVGLQLSQKDVEFLKERGIKI